jgi:hypothetical protein
MKYRGLNVSRLAAPGGSTERERAFAEIWEEAQQDNQALHHLMIVSAKEGEPGAYKPMGPFGPAFAKKPLGETSERDEIVAATVMQWLGTNVGFAYVEKALAKAGYKLVQTRFR